jgi:ribonuclease D
VTGALFFIGPREFIAAAWRHSPELAMPRNPGRADHQENRSEPVLGRYLGLHITKDEQQSDWAADVLRDEQIAYAAADVRYLAPLLDVMKDRAQALHVWELAQASFTYMPARVALDLRGSGDVFAY